MNAIRKQRLILIILLLIGISTAVLLALLALEENINHYFSPTQIAKGEAPTGKTIRAGGLVVHNSVIRIQDGLKLIFMITDGNKQIRVHYDGILPDLFKEGQAIVAQGTLNENNHFTATEVLAKHDETYTPSEVQKSLDTVRYGLPPSTANKGVPYDP